MKLASDIFLDTQVFYTNNFDFDRTAFKEIVRRAESDRIRVFLTSITVREVKRHIRKKVREARNAIDKLRKDLKILENSTVPEVASRARRLNVKAVVEELSGQFDQFIKQTRAEVLDCNGVDPELVFHKYFTVALPFEEREEKRHEFPDAFAIEVLKAFVEREKSPLNVITGDKGFQGAARAANMKVFETVEEFLDSENREWDTKVTEHVLECYVRNTDTIKREIENDFANATFVLVDVAGDGDVSETNITELAVDDDPLVVRIDNDSAILETQVRIVFTAAISYDDPDATVYDKEDGRKYVFNTIEETVEQSVEFPLEVTVDFDPLNEAACGLSIGEINEGRDFEVSSSY